MVFFILFYKEGVLDWGMGWSSGVGESMREEWGVAHLYAHMQPVSAQVCTGAHPSPSTCSIPLDPCLQASYHHLCQVFSSEERGRSKGEPEDWSHFFFF